MVWFRKSLVAIFAVVLFFALLDAVLAFNINTHFGKPDSIKTWLAESKIYDEAVSAVLNNTQDEDTKNGGDGSISLKEQLVQTAAKEAFSPQLLQTSANTFIDANYNWLNGKTATPQFKINLTQAKEDFATKVGKAVEARLTKLPVCTAKQEAMLQIPVNVLDVPCRPAKLNPKTEGERVANEIRTSDFLSKPVITADSLAHDENNKSAKAYYVKLSRAPEIFQAQQMAPIVLSIVALLSCLAIIFISPDRRKGWRRIGSVSLTAGLVLIISKISADITVNKLSDHLAKSDTVVGQLKKPLLDLMKHIESQLEQFNLYAGIALVLIALIIYAVLYKTRDASRKPKTPRAPTIDEDEPADEKPTAPATPRIPSSQVTGAGQEPTGPPVFKTPQQTPKRKNPRPPRLVQ